ncbi:MAG: hypothetical protein H6R01_441 [Burkholderiaceae bacterium]|nr:hypothetical protein [Burkholderiaceae bacterium]
MDEATFDGIVDHEIQQAVWWQDSAIKADRERNYQYYLGLPMGNEVEGRSQVVSWDVFETIESAMPDLLEIFLAGDNVGEFEPVGANDEQFAQQATDYINYIVRKQNPGFLIFNTWFKDALMAKLGIVRAYWNEEETVKKEEYRGVDENGLVMLLDNQDVEVVAQFAYPDPLDAQMREQAMMQLSPEQIALMPPPKMLFDLTVNIRRSNGRVVIDGVRPETFVISKRATKQADATIQGEIRPFMRSDLVAMGIKKGLAFSVLDYDVSLLDTGDSLKDKLDDSSETWRFDDESSEKATEEVLLFSGYVLADYDGDGIAEWRYVLRGGNITLKNEEAEPDYCLLTPIPIPHSIYGMALADPVAPIQATNTALARQYLDSLYIANNPRTYAVDGQVNLDDLLNNRIGGVVRIKQAGAVGPLEIANVSSEALQGIEFMDTRRELRTGQTRYNQGLDADSLNKTATGVRTITTKGDKRTMMIARIFAETGVRDLFKLVLKLVCMNQDKAATIKLRDKWVSFDPREWSHEMDVTINVGLGSGDKTEQVQLWQAVIAMQKEAMAVGLPLADHGCIYQALQQLLKAMGVKGAELYFKDPHNAPPKPPTPPPQPSPDALVKAKADVETAHIKAQADLKRQEYDMAQIQQQKDLEMEKLQQEMALKEREMMLRHALEEKKHADEMALKREIEFARISNHPINQMGINGQF